MNSTKNLSVREMFNLALVSTAIIVAGSNLYEDENSLVKDTTKAYDDHSSYIEALPSNQKGLADMVMSAGL